MRDERKTKAQLVAELAALRHRVEELERARAAVTPEDDGDALERRFRRLVEHSWDVIIVVDESARITFASDAVTRVLGYPIDEYVGRNVIDLVHPDDREIVESSIADALSDPCARPTAVVRGRHKSGTWRWIEAIGLNLLDDPDVRGILVIFRDVSEWRQAIDALRASREWLSTVVASAPVVLWTLDANGVFTLSEGRALEVLGLEPGQLVGRSVFEVYEAHPDVLEYNRRALNGEHVNAVVDVNGTSWDARYIPVRDSDGAVTGIIGVATDITVHRRAQEELHRERVYLDHLFESIPEAIVLVDHDGLVLRVNREFTQLFGYAPDEALGRRVDELIAPEGLQREAFSITHQVAAGERVAVEGVRRTKDGRDVEVSILGAPVTVGGDVAVYGIYRDITARRGAERALRESEAKLRGVVQNAPVILFALDHDGRFTLSEGRGLAALGLKSGDVVGESAFTLYAENPDIIDNLRRGLEGQERTWVADVQGTYFDTSVFPVRNREGECDGLMGIATDVTAIKRAEADYRALVDHATYGIYRSSPGGRFLMVNPALITMLGYETPDELVGLDMRRDLYADPEERDRAVAQFAASGRIAELEVRWKRKDGDLITVRLSGRPVHDARGELECFEMIAEDVTEQRQLEAQLRQVQKMEAIGQLTGGIAHDFNNLLTVIAANAELISGGLVPHQDDLQENLEDLLSAARSGGALVKKLLGFSRQAMLDLKPMDVARVIQDAANVMRRIVPENIEFLLFADRPVGAIRADPVALEQILLNLTTNARDAMPEGGVLSIAVDRIELDEAFRATHAWHGPATCALVTVHDTGVGMSAETREHIFEPFFSRKPHGVGTGLGMAMVYGLVKQLEGYVDVLSEPDGGTEVRLYFPLVEGEELVEAELESVDLAIVSGTETILVAEDEPAIRRALKRALEHQGYTVLLAADGEEALNLFREQESDVDLVISDLVMPKLGGQQLYEALEREGKRVRVLFMSGYSAREVRDSGVLRWNAPFLHKPWTLGELFTAVREVLDGE
jgi:PAS domain S-box-containing protein